MHSDDWSTIFVSSCIAGFLLNFGWWVVQHVWCFLSDAKNGPCSWEALSFAKGKLQRPLTRTGVCLLIKWVIYGTNMIEPNIDEDFKTLECFFDVHRCLRDLAAFRRNSNYQVQENRMNWETKGYSWNVRDYTAAFDDLTKMQAGTPTVDSSWFVCSWICHPRSLTAETGANC